MVVQISIYRPTYYTGGINEKMAPSVFSTTVVLCFCFILVPQDTNAVSPTPDKYKFLYFPVVSTGSHFMTISQSAKVLARLGHHVTFLSSNDAPKWQRADDADVFSRVVFKTRYTKTDEMNAAQELSRTTLRGESRNGFFIFNTIYDSVVYGNPSIVDVFLGQCDDLLSDDLVIAKLRSEEFDMLVGDSSNLCNSILAQKLNIPFVLCVVYHQYQPKIDCSRYNFYKKYATGSSLTFMYDRPKCS